MQDQSGLISVRILTSAQRACGSGGRKEDHNFSTPDCRKIDGFGRRRGPVCRIHSFRRINGGEQSVTTAYRKETYYHSVYVALGKQRRQTIDDILLTDGANRRSLWLSVKLDPGAPTLKEFRRLVGRLKWLKSLRLHDPHLFAMIPPVKVRHLLREGMVAKEETLCHLSPYLTEHINRFGVYDWNSKRPAPSLDYESPCS